MTSSPTVFRAIAAILHRRTLSFPLDEKIDPPLLVTSTSPIVPPSPPTDPLVHLPYVPCFRIFTYLNADDLKEAACVNKAWHGMTEDPEIWRQLYYRASPHHTLKTGSRIHSGNLMSSKRVILNHAQVREAIPDFPGWKKMLRAQVILDYRWRKGKLTTKHLTPQPDAVYCVRFDAKKIVTGCRDRALRVWHPRTGHCVLTIPNAHKASVLCMLYDEEILVTGGSDAIAWVWSLPGFHRMFSLVGHEAGVLDVCFDAAYIVTCSKDATIKIWSRRTGTLLRTLYGHQGPVNAVQIHGDIIASASGDGTIRLWNIHTGAFIKELSEPGTRGFACIRFDGTTLISGSNDHRIRIWDIQTGRVTQILSGHRNLVRTLWVDSKWICSGSYDQTVKVWDRKTGELVLDLCKGHTSWVFDVCFDAGRIVSCCQDGRVCVWDFNGGGQEPLPTSWM